MTTNRSSHTFRNSKPVVRRSGDSNWSKQRGGQECEAGRRHQLAAVVVWTPLPRHQPTRCEQPADDSEDDEYGQQRRDRAVQEELDEHPDLRRDIHAPCHDPEGEVPPGRREATRHPRATGAERSCGQPARRHRAQPIIGRLLGAEPAAAVAAGLLDARL